jgi:hypothetical protein
MEPLLLWPRNLTPDPSLNPDAHWRAFAHRRAPVSLLR